MLKRGWFSLVFLASACSSTLNVNPDGGNNDASGDGSGGDSVASCSSSADCTGNAVCDPESERCTENLACNGHGDCGGGAYCETNDICTPSETGAPCDDDVNCLGEETCLGSGLCGCGGEFFDAESVPPNMLIVLDRSSSMNEPGGGGDSKWEIAQDAIATILTNYGSQVRFGLKLFPGTNQSCSTGAQCTTGHVPLDPGVDTADNINTYLASTGLCVNKGTPIAAVLNSLTSYAGLEDTTRPNTILLITDGAENCSGSPDGAASTLFNENPSIKTYVIGFGSGVDEDELNDLATAGGTAKAEEPFYYQADNPAELNAALTEIAGSVLSCTYTLSATPADLSKLFIFFDGDAVPRDTDHDNGWDYDTGSDQLDFYGAACDSLQSGDVDDLAIVYGCTNILQ